MSDLTFDEWAADFQWGEGTGVSGRGPNVDWSTVGEVTGNVAQGLFSFLGSRQAAGAQSALAQAQQAQAQAQQRMAEVQAQLGLSQAQAQVQMEQARAQRQQTIILATVGGVVVLGALGAITYALARG